MATKTKDGSSSVVGKGKKTPSSNIPTRSTKRSSITPFISDKPIPNYLKPTISSLPESLKQSILNRPNLDRRRSFDKPPSPSTSRLPKSQNSPSHSRQGLVSPSHVPRVRSLNRSNTLPVKCRNIVPSKPNSGRRISRKSSPTPSHEADSKRPIEEVINVVETESRNDHEENSNSASASEVEVERVEENVSQLIPPQDVEENQNIDPEDDDNEVIPPTPIVVSEEQEKIKDDDEHEKEEEQEKIKDDEHEKEEEQEKVKDDEHEKEVKQEKIKDDEPEKEVEQEKIKDDEHEKEVEQEKIKDDEHEKEDECINEEINGSTTEGEVDEIKEEEKEEGGVISDNNNNNIIVEEDQKKNEEEEEKEGGRSEEVEVVGEEEHEESSSEVEEVKVKVEEESTKPIKKESHSQVSNDVIEETASKLLEERKNKVRALAGAFQTVIDYQTK